jgi:N-acetylglucosamine kinase-like BadF-type ATPase
MDLWLGIDGGGTGSRCVALDRDKNVLLHLDGPKMQARLMSFEDLTQVVAQFIDQVITSQNDGSIKGIGLGVAGMGTTGHRQQFTQLLTERWPAILFKVRADAEIAHIGAFAGQDGILVISGTGSIVWGLYRGTWIRAGGFGPLIGDEGGGTRIGMEGLSVAGLAWDGGDVSTLCDLLSERYSIHNGQDMVDAVYKNGLKPSDIAPLVLEAAMDGDRACESIVVRQAGLLAKQVSIVAGKFGTSPIQVALWGGLQKNSYFADVLWRSIQVLLPDAQHHHIQFEPCYGAALTVIHQ